MAPVFVLRVPKWTRAVVVAGVVGAALIACSGSGGSAGAAENSRLRLLNLAVISGGDEHDEIGASDNGRWWVIGRYETDRVVLANIRTGQIRTVAGLKRESGNPYEVTNGGHVEADPHRASYPTLALDRTDGGQRLYAVKTSIFLSSASGTARNVATGFPRLGPELSGSFSEGTISESGHVVTLLTTHSYDAADRNHSVDVYQFDLRSGAKKWVSRANSAGGGGVAASANGRFVVFAGTPASGTAKGAHGVALRWDRKSDKTVAISLKDNGRAGRHGVTGDLSVTDDGRVAFVSYDCNLTAAAPPRGASSCLYVSAPA
jgi:hypothetical protein